MSGKGCACCTKGGGFGELVLVLVCLAAVAAAMYVAAVVLAGVFSWHGLAYCFGLAAAGPLRFAPAVRLTTFALLIELGAAVSLVLDYLDGRRSLRFRWAWGIAHVTLARRVVFAAGWAVVSMVTLASDVAAHRPVRLVSTRIGVLGLGPRLTRGLSELCTACAALVLYVIRRRRTATPVVAMVTTDHHEAITGEVVGARIHDAA